MKYWPLSPAGSFLFLSSLYLVGTGVPRGQGYAIFLGVFFLLYLSGVLIRILILAFSFEGDRFQWRLLWNYAGTGGGRKNFLLSLPARSPFGVRYLFLCRGILSDEREKLYAFTKRVPFAQESRSSLVLPLPGSVSCSGRLYFSDLFGLIRYPLTAREHRSALYHPPLLTDRVFPPPSAAEKDEENIKNSPSQPEKILMRDYQPGDLVRDINWKASGKFTSIYTRIAPDLERSVTRMALIIRSEGTLDLKEPAGSALLLGLKSLGETVIHTMARDFPECRLEVYLGETLFLLEDEEKRDECLARISRMGRRGRGAPDHLPDGGIVCTTPADGDLGLLREKYGDRVFLCGCRGGQSERGEPFYSLFRGNALPLGDRLAGSLLSLRPEKRILPLLPSRPDLNCALETGVVLWPSTSSPWESFFWNPPCPYPWIGWA